MADIQSDTCSVVAEDGWSGSCVRSVEQEEVEEREVEEHAQEDRRCRKKIFFGFCDIY